MIGNSLNKLAVKTTFSFAITGFATLLTLSTANAGFDWVPPAGTSASESVSTTVPILDSLESVVPVPVPLPPVLDGDMGAPSLMSGMSGDITAPGIAVIPAVNQMPMAAVPVDMSPNIRSATQPDRFYEDVHGFGDGLPLAMALGQIVPPDYTYSFAEGVDPGTRVSWEGGRPWNLVLIDMMAPHGFEPAIIDKTVVVRVAAIPAPPPVPAYMVPPPAQAKVTPIPAPYRSHELVSSSATGEGVLDPRFVTSWEGYPGSSLKRVLENWSEQAHVKLYWRSPYDYPLNSAFRIQGTYPEAVEAILSAYGASVPSPAGRLHPNLPYGPSVLIVE